MPKSRGRRKRGKQTTRIEIKKPPLPATSKPEKFRPLPHLENLRRRSFVLARWVSGAVVAGLGTVAGLYSILGGPLWPTPPDIEPGEPSYSSPFLIPFMVRNPSALFPIKNPQLGCRFAYIHTDTNIILDNPGFTRAAGKDDAILPEQTRPYRCPFLFKFYDHPGGKEVGKVVEAKLNIIMEYDSPVLGHRTATIGPFSWDANTQPPRWVKGNLLK